MAVAGAAGRQGGVRTSSKVRAPHLIAAVPAAPRTTLDLETAGDTPILREYRAVKADHPDAIVLARLGDFFEMFGADALIAAPILGVQLTGRGFGSAGRLPMCGVPHQAVVQHIRKLLDAGQRVAIWDQVGEVVSGRLVRREVTRVLSPGMVVEAELLDPAAVSRCVALFASRGRAGIAAFDPNTQHLELFEVAGRPGQRCGRRRAGAPRRQRAARRGRDADPGFARGAREGDSARRRRLRHDTGGRASAPRDRCGLARRPGRRRGPGVRAGGGCGPCLLRACPYRHQPGPAPHRDPPGRRRHAPRCAHAHQPRAVHAAQRARRVAAAAAGRDPDTDGLRLLRARLHEPLTDVEQITRRLDSIEALLADREARRHLREALGGMRDLERLVARCVQRMATPRDLGAVRDACTALDATRAAARALAPAAEIAEATERCRAPDGLADSLRCAALRRPPGRRERRRCDPAGRGRGPGRPPRGRKQCPRVPRGAGGERA